MKNWKIEGVIELTSPTGERFEVDISRYAKPASEPAEQLPRFAVETVSFASISITGDGRPRGSRTDRSWSRSKRLARSWSEAAATARSVRGMTTTADLITRAIHLESLPTWDPVDMLQSELIQRQLAERGIFWEPQP